VVFNSYAFGSVALQGLVLRILPFPSLAEPVGAFGWYPRTTIEAFPGGRFWLVSRAIRGGFGV
jgi:hypothetical protein